MHSSFLIVLLLFVCLIKQVSCISWFYLIMALLKKILIITVVVYALYTLWDRHLKCNMSSIISSVVSLFMLLPKSITFGKKTVLPCFASQNFVCLWGIIFQGLMYCHYLSSGSPMWVPWYYLHRDGDFKSGFLNISNEQQSFS